MNLILNSISPLLQTKLRNSIITQTLVWNFLRWVQEFRLNTMRMEFLSTSCGGTSSVMVRRSTFWYDSIQGNTKNSPAKIYHDKRWSLIYQCYKIKLIAVSTTILHIFSVVFVVKLFPDTYIISVYYNRTCEIMYISSEWYTHYKCRRIIQCSYDWINITGFSLKIKHIA